MELDKAATAAQARVIGVKSWTAYAGVLALAALLFLVALPLAFRWNELAAAAVLGLSALVVGYRFLLVRSVQLYYDDIGVWVVSGVLPWARGVSARIGSIVSLSPSAIFSCQCTRSIPVTTSVTGCSTCSRVFISRK